MFAQAAPVLCGAGLVFATLTDNHRKEKEKRKREKEKRKRKIQRKSRPSRQALFAWSNSRPLAKVYRLQPVFGYTGVYNGLIWVVLWVCLL